MSRYASQLALPQGPPVVLGGMRGIGPYSGLFSLGHGTGLASAARAGRLHPNPAAQPQIPTPGLATTSGIMQAAQKMASAKLRALLRGDFGKQLQAIRSGLLPAHYLKGQDARRAVNWGEFLRANQSNIQRSHHPMLTGEYATALERSFSHLRPKEVIGQGTESLAMRALDTGGRPVVMKIGPDVTGRVAPSPRAGSRPFDMTQLGHAKAPVSDEFLRDGFPGGMTMRVQPMGGNLGFDHVQQMLFNQRMIRQLANQGYQPGDLGPVLSMSNIRALRGHLRNPSSPEAMSFFDRQIKPLVASNVSGPRAAAYASIRQHAMDPATGRPKLVDYNAVSDPGPVWLHGRSTPVLTPPSAATISAPKQGGDAGMREEQGKVAGVAVTSPNGLAYLLQRLAKVAGERWRGARTEKNGSKASVGSETSRIGSVGRVARTDNHAPAIFPLRGRATKAAMPMDPAAQAMPMPAAAPPAMPAPMPMPPMAPPMGAAAPMPPPPGPGGVPLPTAPMTDAPPVPLPANPRLNPPRPKHSDEALGEAVLLRLMEDQGSVPAGGPQTDLLGMGDKIGAFDDLNQRLQGPVARKDTTGLMREYARAPWSNMLGGASSFAFPGAIAGGLLGWRRGNTPEGIGRGLVRGMTTGAGAGLGSALGAHLSQSATSPLAKFLWLLGGMGAGGAGGYWAGGKLLGKPVSADRKRKEKKAGEWDAGGEFADTEEDTPAGTAALSKGWQWRFLNKEIAEGQKQWSPRLIRTEATPVHELLASPGKSGLLSSLLGAGIGGAAGLYGGRALERGNDVGNVAGGVLGGGLLGGLLGYAHRRRSNDRLMNAMRYLPSGATLGDLKAYEKTKSTPSKMDKAKQAGDPISGYWTFKTAEQDNNAPSRSATGESRGLRFADGGKELFGTEAWDLSRWAKSKAGHSRTDISPFEFGKHGNDAFALGFFDYCDSLGLNDAQVKEAVERIGQHYGSEAQFELRAGLEKRAFFRINPRALREGASALGNWFGAGARQGAKQTQQMLPGMGQAARQTQKALPGVERAMLQQPATLGNFIRPGALGQSAFGALAGTAASDDLGVPWWVGAAGGAAAFHPRGLRTALRNPKSLVSAAGFHPLRGAVTGGGAGYGLDWLADAAGWENHPSFATYGALLGGGGGLARGLGLRRAAMSGAGRTMAGKGLSRGLSQFATGLYEPVASIPGRLWNLARGVPNVRTPAGGLRAAGRLAGGTALGLTGLGMAGNFVANRANEAAQDIAAEHLPAVGDYLEGRFGKALSNYGLINPETGKVDFSEAMPGGETMRNIGKLVGPMADKALLALGLDPERVASMSPTQKALMLGGPSALGLGALTGHPLLATLGGLGGAGGWLPYLMQGQGQGAPAARNEWQHQRQLQGLAQ